MFFSSIVSVGIFTNQCKVFVIGPLSLPRCGRDSDLYYTIHRCMTNKNENEQENEFLGFNFVVPVLVSMIKVISDFLHSVSPARRWRCQLWSSHRITHRHH